MNKLDELISDLPYTIRHEGNVEHLIKYAKELDYASQYNGKLNEFLQKRNLPPKLLGRHVVPVVMECVEELEKENKRYKQALEFYANEKTYERRYDPYEPLDTDINDDRGRKARKALEGEE